ncbi:MAG: hypothetical protein A2X12_09445 [Bacteroidetes bacterium GWE2_29_8]|nr:MAG: hypothetical protein A2X12_09445 [Bacteroidetes bacterium GWE2_29_8]OFY18491.1 MAG: hypothetical protein A2X02_07705 [Bacteroidetes bacterium GWF2_29_10]
MEFIDIEEYNYPLPEKQIALFPTNNREYSKLLIYKDNDITDSNFSQIHNYINKNSLLILNDTKVFNARFILKKKTGSEIEIFCLEPAEANKSFEFLEIKTEIVIKCFIGNAKKWKNETLSINNNKITLEASLINKSDEYYLVKFSWNDSSLTFYDITEIFGKTPLPPYIKREPIKDDKQRYQTVYAKNKGSVAAPTAGLHFTPDILNKLKSENIKIEYITLNVGAGTFKPITTQNVLQHNMHTENFTINISLLETILKHKDSITAVGTTSLRTLESLYWIGYKAILNNNLNDLFIDQWEVYKYTDTNKFSFDDIILNLIKLLKQLNITQLVGATKIMIVPGYKFKVVNTLITNFHQPKSTLLLLIAAFIGNDWRNIYNYALTNNYRFLSYGDSSILYCK